MFTENGKVCLEVQDSGKGIAPEKLREIQTQGSGVGMQGMRERVQQFGGSMDIQSSELGTRVSFAFPVPDQKPEMLCCAAA
jgi:signal transduction histidine kinase